MQLPNRIMETRFIPVLLFLAGAVSLLIGIFVTKENSVVMNKAIRICLECIGIG